MAGTYDVKETTKGNAISSTVDGEGYITRSLTREFSIVLDVGTSDSADTVQAATQSAGTLPKEYDYHPNNRTFTADSVSTKRESVIYYLSTVTYKTKPYKKGDEEEEPLELPAEVEYFTAIEDRPIDDDYDGDPIQNTGTEETIELTIQQADLGVTITKNMWTFNPSSIYTYTNKVNSDLFLGFPPGTAKIQDIRARNATDGEVFYWVVTVQIMFREPRAGDPASEAWYQRILHQGYKALIGGVVLRAWRKKDGTIVAPGTKDATKVTQPIKLDANGEPLPIGGTTVYKKYKVYGSTAFSGLGLF
jgi:hypothetical protein